MITHIWAITLTVSDLHRAVQFYQDTLGLTKKYRFGDYAGFDCGGVETDLTRHAFADTRLPNGTRCGGSHGSQCLR